MDAREGPCLAATALRSPNMHTRLCDVSDPKAVAEVAAEIGAPDRVVHAAGISILGAALEFFKTKKGSEQFSGNTYGR